MKTIIKATLVLTLGFGFMTGLMAGFQSCVPISKRVVAPIVCESGYIESLVSTEYVSDHEDGSLESTLYCVEADGKTRSIADFKVFALSALMSLALLFGLALLGVSKLLTAVFFRKSERKHES